MIDPEVTKTMKQLNFEACLGSAGIDKERLKSWLGFTSKKAPIDMVRFVEKLSAENLLTIKPASHTWQTGELVIIQWGGVAQRSYSFAFVRILEYVETREEASGDILPKLTPQELFFEEVEALGEKCGAPTIYGLLGEDLQNAMNATFQNPAP